MSGPDRAHCADALLVFERGVAALHEREDPVGSALNRQMQMIGELRHTGEGVDQAVVEFQRMGSGEADAFDAGCTAATWWIRVARSTTAPSAVAPA